MARGTSWLFKFLAIVAALNIAWLISNANDLPQSLEMRRFRLVIALVISAVAAWGRRTIGLWISFVALLWIVLEYVLWWLGSHRVIEASASSFSRSPHIAYFLHARWWDMVVLGLTIIGLVWCGRNLAGVLTKRERN